MRPGNSRAKFGISFMMIGMFSRAATAWAVVGVLLALAACSPEQTVEERANALDRQLICPICPGETIDQAQVQVAKDMRQVVREKLAAGESEEEIRDFFVERYGVQVLASPPASGFNLLIWVVPPVALAVALGGLSLVLRDMRRRRSVAAADGVGASEAELEPYLEAVDAEMRMAEGTAGKSDADGNADEVKE